MGVFDDLIPQQQAPAKSESSAFADLIPQRQVESLSSRLGQSAGNLLAGAVRGAGSIGATILAPYDMAKDALDGKGISLESNRQRRADMDFGLKELGAEPDSMLYQGGKLAGEIAGTAGVPGVLAKGAQAINAAPKVVSALASGGFKLGTEPAATVVGKVADAALRTGAGAAVGATAAGMVNPEDAGTGAVVGGAMPGAVKVAGEVGRGIKAASANLLGATTGTSAETVAAAFRAGKDGATDFVRNMRGQGEFDDVVATAKQGLENMRAARAAEYRNGMAKISSDKSVLDFKPIDDAMNRVMTIGNFKGVQTNKHAASTVNELADTVAQWKALDPAEYHTPEGLDALKRAIGDVRDSTQFGTPARKAADAIYNAVKGEITNQAPTYAKVMGDYQRASQTLDEITRALSLGDKASKDTAVRKLQSLMRNNAQSNYGNRLSLAADLEQQGGVSLAPAIAGQAMNTWVPRGMVGAIEKGAIGLGSILNPALLAAAPAASPRAVGEVAYALGRASGGTSRMAQALANASPSAMRELTEGAVRVSPVIGLAGRTSPQETR